MVVWIHLNTVQMSSIKKMFSLSDNQQVVLERKAAGKLPRRSISGGFDERNTYVKKDVNDCKSNFSLRNLHTI